MHILEVILEGPPGLHATWTCYWVGWGLRSLYTAFPCWSCLSYLYFNSFPEGSWVQSVHNFIKSEKLLLMVKTDWRSEPSYPHPVPTFSILSCLDIFSYNFSAFSSWLVPIFFLEKCLMTFRICCLILTLSLDVVSAICRLHYLWSPCKIPFYLVSPIVFSFRAHAIYYLGTIRRFSWNGTKVSNWRFHDNRRMNTSAIIS
jgi:hypothetical protein